MLAAVLSLQIGTGAQSLSLSLFERYLGPLREQAGIPALSGLIRQNGVDIWARGMGRPALENAASATPDTPYPLGPLSQIFGSTLLLKKCVDESHAEVSDLVRRWHPTFPEGPTLLRDLLTHTSPAGTFLYAPDRFANLTPVVVECANIPYARLLADEILVRLGMSNSAPDLTLATALPVPTSFSAAELTHYADVAQRTAAGYRIDSRGRATRTDLPPAAADAATGVVSTVRDLSRFDAALDVLLEAETRQAAWAPATAGAQTLPSGMGWFVQQRGADRLIWQFGTIDGAYSSLIVKVPARELTLILLANSDGLTAPFALDKGDVTKSPFARLFLETLVP